MLEDFLAQKTISLIEKEKEVLEKDFLVIKKILEYLHANQNLCIELIQFRINPEKLKQLISNLSDLEHLLVKTKKGEHILEIKSIGLLSRIISNTSDKEIESELKALLVLFEEQQAALKNIIEIDKRLIKKKYSQNAVESLAKEIRGGIRKLSALLKNHAVVIAKITGALSAEESNQIRKIELKKQMYGRIVSKRRAKFMREFLMLSDNAGLVPCFVLTSTLETLIVNIKNKQNKDKIINMFRAIGTMSVQEIVLFRIKEFSKDADIAKVPPAQPQRIEGLIEQKLPHNTRIEIIKIYKI